MAWSSIPMNAKHEHHVCHQYHQMHISIVVEGVCMLLLNGCCPLMVQQAEGLDCCSIQKLSVCVNVSVVPDLIIF